jgi:hypothetical protein
MPKRSLSKQEQQLAEQLRHEAIESRPAFSESLHRRILSAVKQGQAAESQMAENVPLLRRSSAAPDREVTRRWQRVLAIALTAACLLCAVGTGWVALRQNSVEKPSVAPPSLAQLPSVGDLTDHTVDQLDDLTVAAVLEPQTTPLKNDARAVASVFLDRLPVPVKMVDNR